VYDPATETWASAAPLPTPRSGLAGAYYHGLILVLGGELPLDHTFSENEGYDPKTDGPDSLLFSESSLIQSAQAAEKRLEDPSVLPGSQSRSIQHGKKRIFVMRITFSR
jgi:hypothetical protein